MKKCVGWAKSSRPTIVRRTFFRAMVGRADLAHPTASCQELVFHKLGTRGDSGTAQLFESSPRWSGESLVEVFPEFARCQVALEFDQAGQLVRSFLHGLSDDLSGFD